MKNLFIPLFLSTFIFAFSKDPKEHHFTKKRKADTLLKQHYMCPYLSSFPSPAHPDTTIKYLCTCPYFYNHCCITGKEKDFHFYKKKFFPPFYKHYKITPPAKLSLKKQLFVISPILITLLVLLFLFILFIKYSPYSFTSWLSDIKYQNGNEIKTPSFIKFLIFFALIFIVIFSSFITSLSFYIVLTKLLWL